MKKAHPSRFLVIAVILVAACAPPVFSQEFDALTQQATCSGNRDISLAFKTRYRALREIDDPGTHQRWLLVRDLDRASGPGLFIELFHSPACTFFASGTTHSGSGVGVRPLPAIHAGDPVILSEHTNFSDAELEATALESAAAGDTFRVRLRFGGFTVRAIATAPGRGTLASEAGKRRP